MLWMLCSKYVSHKNWNFVLFFSIQNHSAKEQDFSWGWLLARKIEAASPGKGTNVSSKAQLIKNKICHEIMGFMVDVEDINRAEGWS